MWIMVLFGCSSYDAGADSFGAYASDEAVRVRNEGKFVLFEPTAAPEAVTVIFYPGGLVEPSAYAGPMRRLAEAGYPAALVSMPSNLAVYAPNRADKVRDSVDAEKWVIAGHSLGGAMGASYAAKNDDLAGLALWAAYPAGGKDLSDTDLAVLSLTGTEDGVLDVETYEERKALLPAETSYVSIEGGNHAGFGDYGAQDGDGRASISLEEQHEAINQAMLDFLEEL